MDNAMKKTDKSRKWMWWFLAIVAATQLYFVQELLAAFALFAVVFAVIAGLVTGGYLLHKGWTMATRSRTKADCRLSWMAETNCGGAAEGS